MTHLEFVDILEKLGISIRGNIIVNQEKQYEVPIGLSYHKVTIKDFNVKWTKEKEGVLNLNYDPKESLIKKAINLDTWKHSLHTEIVPKNYEKLREIVQQKIIDRASEIEFLVTVYFLLNKEMSDEN